MKNRQKDNRKFYTGKQRKWRKSGTGQGISCPVLPNPFRLFPRMGHGLGQTESKKTKPLQKLQKAKENRQNRKIPAAIGGDYWTRTRDLLRVKIRQGRKERVIPSFPPFSAQNHLLSAPLFPVPTACSISSLGHGLGQTAIPVF